MKHSLDLLRHVKNTIPIPNHEPETFEPIFELIEMELYRRNHSKYYVKEAMSKKITSCSMQRPTKRTDMIWFKLWDDTVVLKMNLKRMSECPHWLYKILEDWGFDLTDADFDDE